MQAAGAILLAPWRTYPGLIVLYGALLVHAALGFVALYRRRHLRMPPAEAWQLVLGLSIPLLLAFHVIRIRAIESFGGFEVTYQSLMYRYSVDTPEVSMPRQSLLLIILWAHGCIGLRSWLRTMPWYTRASSMLASLATLIPVVAVLGVISAGLDLREAVVRDPVYAAKFAASIAVEADRLTLGQAILEVFLIAYLGLMIGAFGLRAMRDWHSKRYHAIHIAYPGGRIAAVPPGFSILEASRWTNIPHASVCGGRGRCSTCRVRIVKNIESLPKPSAIEGRTLRYINAPPHVRLACQTRPTADISVEPLVSPSDARAGDVNRFSAVVTGGRESHIGAMFVDMRGSTGLATGRLPFDALFLFDRYIHAVTRAIRQNSGLTTSIAGDGIMSVFGIDRPPPMAAREALQAAFDVWVAVDALNDELSSELATPLRIGIGIHVGMAIVGFVSADETQSLQFLGDTGNVAAKLEGASKSFESTLIVSAVALKLAVPKADFETTNVLIAGKTEPLEIAVFKERRDLQTLLATIH
jgi:adenylate cyclase